MYSSVEVLGYSFVSDQQTPQEVTGLCPAAMRWPPSVALPFARFVGVRVVRVGKLLRVVKESWAL